MHLQSCLLGNAWAFESKQDIIDISEYFYFPYWHLLNVHSTHSELINITINPRPAGAPGFPRPAGGGGLNTPPPSNSAPGPRSDTG